MLQLLFLCLAALMVKTALAGPACIKEKNPCDPTLLCTFKTEWQSKAHLYAYYASNDVRRKGKKRTHDGIRWNGALYEAAMAEARAMNPNASATEIKQKAASIFQEKIRQAAYDSFVNPPCELGAQPDLSRITKKGYMGMYTLSKDCSIWVNHYAAPIDPKVYGKTDTVCEEFYNKDYAHEQVHQKICQKAKKRGETEHRDTINEMIREEMKSYRHSMKLSEAYYRILLSQCSNRLPNNENIRKQLRNVSRLLKGYETRISQ